MFISFGQFIGLIILTIIMIALIIYLTFTAGKGNKRSRLKDKINNTFASKKQSDTAAAHQTGYSEPQTQHTGQEESHAAQSFTYLNQTDELEQQSNPEEQALSYDQPVDSEGNEYNHQDAYYTQPADFNEDTTEQYVEADYSNNDEPMAYYEEKQEENQIDSSYTEYVQEAPFTEIEEQEQATDGYFTAEVNDSVDSEQPVEQNEGTQYDPSNVFDPSPEYDAETEQLNETIEFQALTEEQINTVETSSDDSTSEEKE